MSAPSTPDPLSGRIPVSILTGVLGSGKTTLLTRLLRDPQMNRVAVVINELGEVGIDHDLVTSVTENVTLLANGCLCCTVRTDLQETLRDLFTRRRNGQIADFDRIVVETTGLADPAPILQTLSSDGLLAAHFRLDGLVTLVDAVNGSGQLETQPESLKQAAIADRLIITKSDLVEPFALQALQERLAQINPLAAVRTAVMGDIEPSYLTGLGLGSARAGLAALDRFLGLPQGETGSPEAAGAYLGRRLGPGHDAGIRSFVLRFEAPFSADVFTAALEMLTRLRGPDLLRVKGFVNVEGAPMVVQGVQHVFHPAVALAAWPSEDRSTRLVFITRRIEPEAVKALFQAAGSLAGA
jgi:G3E family GTPase